MFSVNSLSALFTLPFCLCFANSFEIFSLERAPFDFSYLSWIVLDSKCNYLKFAACHVVQFFFPTLKGDLAISNLSMAFEEEDFIYYLYLLGIIMMAFNAMSFIAVLSTQVLRRSHFINEGLACTPSG